MGNEVRLTIKETARTRESTKKGKIHNDIIECKSLKKKTKDKTDIKLEERNK